MADATTSARAKATPPIHPTVKLSPARNRAYARAAPIPKTTTNSNIETTGSVSFQFFRWSISFIRRHQLRTACLMVLYRVRIAAVEDFFGLGCLLRGTMSQQQEFVGFKSRLVLQNAVLGNAQTVLGRPPVRSSRRLRQRPPAPRRSNSPVVRRWPRPDARNKKECRTNNHPHTPPQKAPLFPQAFIRSPAL